MENSITRYLSWKSDNEIYQRTKISRLRGFPGDKPAKSLQYYDLEHHRNWNQVEKIHNIIREWERLDKMALVMNNGRGRKNTLLYYSGSEDSSQC